MKNTYVLVLAFILTTYIPIAYAGKIKSLNINASDNAQVEITNPKGSQIEKIKIKKAPDSSIKINNKEVDCSQLNSKDGICSPQMY